MRRVLPITNVVSITVHQRNPDAFIQKHFKVLHEVRVDKIASLLEGPVHFVVSVGVVQINSECGLRRCLVEIIDEVGWRCWVVIGVTDIVSSAFAIVVIRTFDIVSAHICRFSANCEV